MTEIENRTQLAVIGAGPGGYPAAFLASELGLEVTMIDPELNPGGVCLYRGCIPTKTLLHIVKVIREAKEAEEWGVAFSDPKIDLDKIRSWKNRIIEKLTAGLGTLCRQRKIKYIQGKASFFDTHTLNICRNDGSFEKLIFEKAILATGTLPATLPNISIDSSRIMNSAEAMELDTIPETILVIGGGYIGLELGSIYAGLGSRVTIVEMMPNLLPGADEDMVRIFLIKNRNLFEDIRLSTKVSYIEERSDCINVTFQDKNGIVEKRNFDKVLVTIGRKPNTHGIELGNTEIEFDENRFVIVNTQMQTSNPWIYAVGDIVGGALLAHKATREGRIAAEVIAGKNSVFTPKSIPSVLFTDPEIAWCGLTEKEAKREGRKVKISKFPWGACGRAATFGRSDGVTKIVIEPDSEKILGVGITGPGAGELISECALAIEMGAKVSDVARTIHPHPTLSETVMEAAELFYHSATHFFIAKK
jgi:dihydrolipoamide dehydrogenase